jgi:hypothetical protein
VLDAPVEQTYSVAALHFDDLKRRYGPVTVINLSEQTGREGVVTNAYGDMVHLLDGVTYVPWDFHAACKGMKWEKIGSLIDELDLEGQGYNWQLGDELVSRQQGIFRTK